MEKTKTGQAHAGGENAAKKWAGVLDLPEDQAIPCVVAFVCLRYRFTITKGSQTIEVVQATVRFA